jgi:hypothetical protein
MTMRSIVFALTLSLMSLSFAFSQSERPKVDSFRVKMLIPDGSNWKMRDAVLDFEQSRIVLRAPKDDFKSVSMTYNEVKRAQYSNTPDRQSIPPAFGLAANVFAFPLVFRNVETHRLTVQSETGETSITLDKTNYRDVVAAFENHAGRKVAGWDIATESARR